MLATKPHHRRRRCGNAGGREPDGTAGGHGRARAIPEDLTRRNIHPLTNSALPDTSSGFKLKYGHL